MAYSTTADLQQAAGGADRLVQLADWDNDRVADATPIANAIAAADGEINSYINKQYLVPLAVPVPQVIVDTSARIAKYRLAVARGMVDQFIKDEHTEDVKWLESLRDGTNSLGVEPIPVQASMRIDAYSPRPTTKDISRLKLKGFT